MDGWMDGRLAYGSIDSLHTHTYMHVLTPYITRRPENLRGMTIVSTCRTDQIDSPSSHLSSSSSSFRNLDFLIIPSI